MSQFRWILGGLIGGAVGILVWVLVGHFTGYEVGWIAWGVGFLVGVGVRYAAHLADEQEGLAQGILAATISIACIVAAKYIVFIMLTGGSNFSKLLDQMVQDDEHMICMMADTIAQEMMNNGQAINWPSGMTYDDASEKQDYPREIWRQAELRWKNLGAEGQQAERENYKALMAALTQTLGRPAFTDTLSAWDLLWVALAAITAFKIGVGTYGSD